MQQQLPQQQQQQQEPDRHIAILAGQPLSVLTKVYTRIITEFVEQKQDCLLSTRALKSAETRYPVLTFTVVTVKNSGEQFKKKLKLYAHHVVMLWKMKLSNPSHYQQQQSGAWDSSKLHVSHNCHNTRCVKHEHLALVTQANNNERNIHCIGIIYCRHCHRKMRLCNHHPPCLSEQVADCYPSCSSSSRMS
jgi:hypothetical protein